MAVSCLQEVAAHSGSSLGFSCGESIKCKSHFVCARFMMSIMYLCLYKEGQTIKSN